MKRLSIVFLIAICLLFRMKTASDPCEDRQTHPETEVRTTEAASETRDGAADLEELAGLLDAALQLQPCTAGNSLRMAALGGGIYKWYAENPDSFGSAKKAALVWGSKKREEERRQAASAVRLLGQAAERMGDAELRMLLEDAGVEWTEPAGDMQGFLRLTEAVARSLTPEIFKGRAEIMNISI